MIPTPICIQEVSVPPVPAALQFVAHAAQLMHKMEGGDELAIGATVQRAYDHLHSLIVKGSGAALVATVDGQYAGCVFMEFGIGRTSYIALASALYTMPGVPRKTALQLMHAAALLCRRRGKSVVWMLAGTERNQQRRTYRGTGFAETEVPSSGNGRLYKANLSDIEIALEKRMKRRKDRIQWDQS